MKGDIFAFAFAGATCSHRWRGHICLLDGVPQTLGRLASSVKQLSLSTKMVSEIPKFHSTQPQHAKRQRGSSCRSASASEEQPSAARRRRKCQRQWSGCLGSSAHEGIKERIHWILYGWRMEASHYLWRGVSSWQVVPRSNWSQGTSMIHPSNC